MAEPVAPVEQQQVQPEHLSDLPVAQPYGVPPARNQSEPVVTQPTPHEPTPPPTPAPVFDSRRNRFIDPETNKIVRDPTKEPVEQVVAEVAPDTVAPVVEPVAIAHTPLTMNLARDLGIPEHIIASTPTADLRAEISLLQQQRVTRPQVAAPAEPVEEPIDWGTNPETGEAYSEKDYQPHMQKVIRNAHKVDLLEKKNAALERQVIQERQSRGTQQTVADINAFFAKHKDIYGSKPLAQTNPLSPEGMRQQSVINNIKAMLAAGQASNPAADCEKIHAGMFGTIAPVQDDEPPTQTGRITPEQWRQSGLAQTAHRNTTPLPKTRRQQIADRVDDEMRRNGVKVPAGAPAGNLSDLPPR